MIQLLQFNPLNAQNAFSLSSRDREKELERTNHDLSQASRCHYATIAFLVGLVWTISGGDGAFANPSPSLRSNPLQIAQNNLGYERKDFTPIDLNYIQVKIGKKPGAIVIEALGSAEAGEGGGGEEILEIKYPRFDRAIAVFTRTGLADDSVNGFRYRVELIRQENQLWRIVWVGMQTKCQPERGHQDWSSKLCS
ncbi:hypothetical protein V2H45_02575 [Tumidithrix elongata RA019]|uniref:Uncharacterized protein n=1 Tax=Tumidithrix elongata BACA0141 TaxID=2716417 RepID=A0AAW9PQE6_9CYAN|nr:hypothetical protein [Tumidithrix elongata RA019]